MAYDFMAMKRVLKILIPVGLVLGAVLAVGVMVRNRPPAPKVEPVRSIPSVEVMRVEKEDVTLSLPSQGMIEAERMTLVAAEVGGRVVRVSEKFNAGEAFEADEILAEVDPADYEAAATEAESLLAEARLALESEQARADQVVKDWAKLASQEEPTEFALRKPHLESAQARVRAAESALFKARRDLERTAIRAPFRGRLRAIHTELGSFLTPGARVAEMFSTGRYEVRLPLSLDDYAFSRPVEGGAAPVPVKLTARFGGVEKRWDAVADRYEGEVERTSRTVILVARLNGPAMEEAAADPFLKPGLFVKAEVEGRSLDGVYRVPRKAFLGDNRLIVLDAESRIRFRTVVPVRGDRVSLLVKEGLAEGERICLTALAAPVEGMTVQVIGEEGGGSTGPSPPEVIP